MPAPQPDQDRPSLFLSYSRADSAFADELNICLESHGFEVYIDREDLFPGERFEPRLEALISEADTTVVVLSPNWIASDYCQKELGIAQGLGRRIIPAVISPVALSALPESVAKVQFVFFTGEGRSFARGLADLVTALRTDIEWVREQSRLHARVEDWERAGRSEALLLRGEALEAAQAWIARPPPAHVSVLPKVAAYISTSDAFSREYRRRQARGRFIGLALGSVTVISLLCAAVFYFQTEAARADARASDARAEAMRQEMLAQNAVFGVLNEEGDEADGEGAEVLFEDFGPGRSGPSLGEDDSEGVGSGTGVGTDLGAAGTAPPRPAETPTRAPAPAPSAPPPDRSAAATTPEARLVANLNSSVKETRLAAGQEVVIALRSEAREAYLEQLVAAIEPPAVRSLTSTGRFNTLYMLNVQPDWKGTRWESRLAAALDRMEAETAIGGQTRDCVDMLRAKLRGDSGTLNICGNVRNYGLDPQRR